MIYIIVDNVDIVMMMVIICICHCIIGGDGFIGYSRLGYGNGIIFCVVEFDSHRDQQGWQK